jgi:hypothetical protein
VRERKNRGMPVRGRVLLLLLICAAAGVTACGDGPADTTSSRVPPPKRFVAPEIPLESCKNGETISGTHVQVAGMTCADADRIIKQFTTAFTDENLTKTVVDRGNGWRCYQQLSPSRFSVQEVCWRGNEQVLLFRK